MRYWMTIMFSVLLLLVGCGKATPPVPSPTPTTLLTPPSPTPAPPPPTLSPTPIPQHLVICSTEPTSANPFAPTPAGDDLLALFYEFPVERVGYDWKARLLTHIPTFASGDVVTQMVTLTEGARYVDMDGVVQTLVTDTERLLPQMLVTFTLKSDLRWSDGVALSAADVMLGYLLAQTHGAYGQWRDLVERTARFTALDDYRLRWESLPGYINADYPSFVFPPQPAHRWSGQALNGILADRTPPGTGAFRVVAWEAGHEVRLEPNPYYAGTKPRLVSITFRFPPLHPNGWSDLLQTQQCDVILPDPVMQTDWRQWSALVSAGQAMIWADPAPVVLRLDFNIAADSPAKGLRNSQTRRAMAYCIDRGRLSEALPGEALLPADSYIPPGHPAFDMESVWRIPYNAEIGQSMLNEIGWWDEDGDGIREAHAIPDIADGTPLSLTLHLAPQYFISAAHIAADLEICGINITPQPTEPQLLYAADAVSPLFGRNFELVLFGWRAELPQVCGSWLSDRIPNAQNAWVGENFSGYQSAAYDAACQRALTAVDTASQWAELRQAQNYLTIDLPTLFLTWRPFWFVARPQVRGVNPDASAASTLWNIEQVFMGE